MGTKLWKIVNTGVYGGVKLSNTFHIMGGGAGELSVANVNTILGHFDTFYTSNASYFATGCSWTAGTRVTSTDFLLPPTQAPVIEGTTPVAGTGGTGGDPLATSTALCINLRTPLAGASYRGKFYMGVMAKTTLGSGLWTAAIVTTILSRVALLRTNIASVNSGLLVVYSPTLGSALSTNGQGADLYPDNLRSRKF